jgi:hypothetical protein
MTGTWVWQTTGNNVNYTKFSSGYPKTGDTYNNCLQMAFENGNWSVGVCSAIYSSYHVCERPTLKASASSIYESMKINDFDTRCLNALRICFYT